jgi:hypothetical protein
VWARQRCADRFTGANTATLNLRFLNAAGAIISTSTVLAGNASTACDQYAQVTLTAIAPPGTVTTRLLLRVNQPASAGGAVHFDDVELSVQ